MGKKGAKKPRNAKAKRGVFDCVVALPIDCGKALSSPTLPQVWLLSLISQLARHAGKQSRKNATTIFPSSLGMVWLVVIKQQS